MNSNVGHKALYPTNSIEYNAANKCEIGINAVELFKSNHTNVVSASYDTLTDSLQKNKPPQNALLYLLLHQHQRSISPQLYHYLHSRI